MNTVKTVNGVEMSSTEVEFPNRIFVRLTEDDGVVRKAVLKNKKGEDYDVLELPAGNRIFGRLDSIREYTNNYGKQNKEYTITSESPETKGEVIAISSAGNLDYKITSAGAAIGKLVEILYTGKQEIAKGPWKGRQSHSFEVSAEVK